MSSASHVRVELVRPGFSLDVDAEWNERVAVIFGPSGSGKSTLFEWVLGLLRQGRGLTRIAGETLEDAGRGIRVPVERRRLGWVPQEPALMPHLNVEGNLRLGLARAGANEDRSLGRAIEVLEIGELLGRRVDELSGGEAQRIALARALASGPRVLLLDEPLSSLDLPLRARVVPFLLRIRDELGLPMLYITHDPDEALLLGETLIVLDAGRVVASGPVREVLWGRAVLPLAEALGLENVVEGCVIEVKGRESVVSTSSGMCLTVPGALEPGTTVRLGLPDRDLMLAAEAPRRISARNVIPATVTRCEQHEGDVRVHLDAGERLVAKLTPSAVESLELAVGRQVFVVIKAQAIRRIA